MTFLGTAPDDLVQQAVRIGAEIAGPASVEVDRLARFPSEAVDALREARMLSSLIPVELGGEGLSLSASAAAVNALARHCASTAMIFAMHQMQVACIVRHGRSKLLQDFLREVAASQLLLGSATTEAGIGGNLRTSSCAVELDGEQFQLDKVAPVISYGEYADAVLVTARRTPESPESDQVLVLCRAPGLVLESISGWDTLGFRGTCSLGFKLSASGDRHAILDDPFGDIASETMLPVSHILWASVWQGLGASAVDRARRYVQADARKRPGVTPSGALRLAELVVLYQRIDDSIRSALNRYEPIYADLSARTDLGFAISLNGLKVAASRSVVDVVARALEICGISGYREDSPFSLGRQLRDAYGAALMVNNDRLLANNAQMLLIHKEL